MARSRKVLKGIENEAQAKVEIVNNRMYYDSMSRGSISIVFMDGGKVVAYLDTIRKELSLWV
jgi:hypothetical protein